MLAIRARRHRWPIHYDLVALAGRGGRRSCAMQIPPSPHFAPVALDAVFTTARAALPPGLRASEGLELEGAQTILGIPFAFAAPGAQRDVILLDGAPLTIDLAGATASYVLLVH